MSGAGRGPDEHTPGGRTPGEHAPGLGRALALTIGSAVLPGLAHLLSGRRTAGTVILGVYLLLVGVAAVAVVVLGDDMAWTARLAVQGRWLLTASAGVFVLTVVWLSVIVHSWVITRPPPGGGGARLLGATVVLALCAVVATPAATVLHTAYTAYDLLSSIFGPGKTHDRDDPWNSRDRVSVLLLGGDSGNNRYGLRTDSMVVASVGVEHGDVVLIGLPRNLRNVPFPAGTALAEYHPPPMGFDGLLNEVYQTVAEAPWELAVDPYATDPAADTLKYVVADAIGLEIDHYALVDMRGFDDLIDAIGGIRVLVEEPIPYGQQGHVIPSGHQHLDGHQALWYARSRVGSDDYTRMGRQGCLIKYVAEQADPVTLLSGYRELAGAARHTLRTDIPQSKVPHFIDLGELVHESGDFRTLQLSPPQVDTTNPDWWEIRSLVAAAVSGQERAQGPDAVGDAVSPPPTPSPSNGEQTGAQGGDTGLPEPSTTTPGRQVGEEAIPLDRLCP